MLAILFSLLMVSQSNRYQLPHSPVSEAEYDQIRNNPKPGISDTERVAAAEPGWTAALALRGHSGDRTYLQGCDLSDPAAEYDESNRQLIKAAGTWEEYAALWTAAFPDHDYRQRVFEGAPEETAKVRFKADQKMRALLSAPAPEGELGSAVAALRSVDQCEVDLPNSEWLQESEAWKMFETTNDGEALKALYYLAIHADDRPHLQSRFGQIYLERRGSMGWPVENGLRLIDRAQINLGQPQPYATAVLCENGKPVFAGTVDLEAANERRISVGLPPQDLNEKATNGFCGKPSG